MEQTASNNKQVQSDSNLSEINNAVAELIIASEDYNQAAKEYVASLKTISRNKEIKQALLREIEELKTKQANMINRGGGSTNELKSISREIYANKDLINSYEVAKEKEDLLDSAHQLKLLELREKLRVAKINVNAAGTKYANEKYLDDGIELLRRVAAKRIKSTPVTDAMEYSGKTTTDVVIGELGGLIRSALEKNFKVDGIDEIIAPAVSASEGVALSLINMEKVGSPIKVNRLKKKLIDEGYSLDK